MQCAFPIWGKQSDLFLYLQKALWNVIGTWEFAVCPVCVLLPKLYKRVIVQTSLACLEVNPSV